MQEFDANTEPVQTHEKDDIWSKISEVCIRDVSMIKLIRLLNLYGGLLPGSIRMSAEQIRIAVSNAANQPVINERSFDKLVESRPLAENIFLLLSHLNENLDSGKNFTSLIFVEQLMDEIDEKHGISDSEHPNESI